MIASDVRLSGELENGTSSRRRTRPQAQVLDLLAEDDRLINVYAAQLEVRPPAAPTTS
jgi:hypothetical protein